MPMRNHTSLGKKQNGAAVVTSSRVLEGTEPAPRHLSRRLGEFPDFTSMTSIWSASDTALHVAWIRLQTRKTAANILVKEIETVPVITKSFVSDHLEYLDSLKVQHDLSRCALRHRNS